MTAPSRGRQPAESRPAMRAFVVALQHLPPLTMADLKVGLAVLELTAGHGKLTDHVVRAEIARRSDVSERTVSRSLRKFVDAELIEWTPARAVGQLGTLMLSRARDMPAILEGVMTRDNWMSRVQPNPGQEGTEPGTESAGTRDSQGGPLPPSDLLEPPLGKIDEGLDDVQIERKTDAVLDHIVDERVAKNRVHIRNETTYRKSVRDKLVDEEIPGGRARVRELVAKYPSAGLAQIAGSALGEPTSLAAYPKPCSKCLGNGWIPSEWDDDTRGSKRCPECNPRARAEEVGS